MLLKVTDREVIKSIKKVFFNGEDITNQCFECFVDFDEPEQGWAKVYLRDENERIKLDPQRKPMWKLIHGKITTEPPQVELRELLRKAGVDVSSTPAISE